MKAAENGDAKMQSRFANIYSSLLSLIDSIKCLLPVKSKHLRSTASFNDTDDDKRKQMSLECLHRKKKRTKATAQ